MDHAPLPRLDLDSTLHQTLLPYCRLRYGEVWEDEKSGHRIGCLNATDSEHIHTLMNGMKSTLAIHDPPYNAIAFTITSLTEFISECRSWIALTDQVLTPDSALYVWLGADQRDDFKPLPDFMMMMREFDAFASRSFITMRNQRGYGTQKNWMAVRQECLFYTKGNPPFQVTYTEIPKILRGYYKTVKGELTENLERGGSPTIRPGNVWVDIQQVFYRMKENVSGCYAQKPLKAIQRIISASSEPDAIVIDFFGHSGTTLIAAETLGRLAYICDLDPVYAEIMIRRLEHYRATGELGWQNGNPFSEELANFPPKPQDTNPKKADTRKANTPKANTPKADTRKADINSIPTHPIPNPRG